MMSINMKTVKLKFLHRALVLVNAYNCAKFQLPIAPLVTEIWRGPKIKIRDCRLPQTRLADKLLHVAKVAANGYQRTNFQLSSSISFGDEGVQK